MNVAWNSRYETPCFWDFWDLCLWPAKRHCVLFPDVCCALVNKTCMCLPAKTPCNCCLLPNCLLHCCPPALPVATRPPCALLRCTALNRNNARPALNEMNAVELALLMAVKCACDEALCWTALIEDLRCSDEETHWRKTMLLGLVVCGVAVLKHEEMFWLLSVLMCVACCCPWVRPVALEYLPAT